MRRVIRFWGDKDRRTKFGKSDSISPAHELLKRGAVFAEPENEKLIAAMREVCAAFPSNTTEDSGVLTAAETLFLCERPGDKWGRWQNMPGPNAGKTSRVFIYGRESDEFDEFYKLACKAERETIEKDISETESHLSSVKALMQMIQ